MGKKSKNDSRFNDNDDNKNGNDPLADMPIARSLLSNDTEALRNILEERVVRRHNRQATVKCCSIEQTVGHAFTGGRSTPVYRITCDILRRQQNGAFSNKSTRHFIAKLVQMDDNDNSAKRRESYAVERRFYDHPLLADTLRSQYGLTLPKILVGDKDGKAAYSTVCWIMNDLSRSSRHQSGSSCFPVQVPFLSVRQAKAALSWLATFHAVGWNDSQHVAWNHNLLHARGGFWTTTTNNNNSSSSSHLQQLPSQWKRGLVKLESCLEDVGDNIRLLRIGPRLQAVCQLLGPFLKEQCKYYGTWIHGDFKAANLLFAATNEMDRAPKDDNVVVVDDCPSSATVAVVDFQFTGWGVCAEDVAYLLYPDAHGSLMESVDELLDFYHEQLVTQIMNMRRGGPSSISRERLVRLFDLALLDLTRYWLSKGWEGTTVGEAQLVLRLEKTLDAIDGGGGGGNAAEVDSTMLQAYMDSTP